MDVNQCQADEQPNVNEKNESDTEVTQNQSDEKLQTDDISKLSIVNEQISSQDSTNGDSDSEYMTDLDVTVPKGKMKKKHEKAAPFYIFFPTMTAVPETHTQPLSITFAELLDASLGKLKSCLQLTYMLDFNWIGLHFNLAGYSDVPLTLVYGTEVKYLDIEPSWNSNVTSHMVEMKGFGLHHTKLGIYHYDDESVRIVVYTANLYHEDWTNIMNGLWISPRCPRLADPVDVENGDSPTGFKTSLLHYLNIYNLPCLSSFIEIVKNADFSSINVFLVGSKPGIHTGYDWALNRINNLLSKYCIIPENETSEWDLIVQSSGVGSFGANPKLWLCGDFQHSFCRSYKKTFHMTKQPSLQFIFPTFSKMKNGFGSIPPYSEEVHVKQEWIVDYFREFSAVHSGRDRAMPHIKTYLRLSPDAKRAAFFLLTSSNVSKSAWGTFNKKTRAIQINSYELGVLFLPKFVINEDSFSVELNDPHRLPVPYDLPPIPYKADDRPSVVEYFK